MRARPAIARTLAVALTLCGACDRPAVPEPARDAPPPAVTPPTAAPQPAAPKPAPPPEPPALQDPVAGLPPPLDRPADFRRGVSLGLFVSSDDEDVRQELYRRFLDEIVEVGATDVQLVVQWSQRDLYATEIAPLPGVSVDDALLRWVIREARARELRVFLMPILHLQERARGHWRGKLRPTDWEAWWRSYRAFILHYAAIARQGGVDLLSVGSELISTESRTERWRSLIADVRARYRGQLTYSANWDHFEPVAFWDALDVAGITGYQELSAQPHPDEDELVRGFAGLVQRVQLWHATTGKRFVFTEIGYPSQIYGARHPWDYRKRGETPDLQLQLRCYRALYRVWHDSPVLAGLYVWNWFGHGGADDQGYTPRGKPAAEVLRHWYARPSPAPDGPPMRGPGRQATTVGEPTSL